MDTFKSIECAFRLHYHNSVFFFLFQIPYCIFRSHIYSLPLNLMILTKHFVKKLNCKEECIMAPAFSLKFHPFLVV